MSAADLPTDDGAAETAAVGRIAGPIIHRCADPEALVAALAERVAGALAAAIHAHGRALIALAGGTTPRALYRRLAEVHGADVDWSRVWVFFGDERVVPVTDPASNFRMAHEALLVHVPVPASQVFAIVKTHPAGAAHDAEAAADAADAYDALIRKHGPLDIVLLGMGEDGHTASIFPATPAPGPGRLAYATQSPIAPHARVSLTEAAIADAETVLVMVSGASKAARLAEVLHQIASDARRLPAARVGSRPDLEWWLDEAAASQLA